MVCLILVFATLNAVAGLSLVNVTIEMREDSTATCIGGNQIGFNRNIRKEYRLLETSLSPPEAVVVGEWVLLSDRFATDRTEEELQINDSVIGLQFRLWQVGHLGGGCGCWEVGEFVVTVSTDHGSSAVRLVNYTISAGNLSDITCYLTLCNINANEARGFISKALYFPDGESGVECPGNSSGSLFSEFRPPLPENCDTITPRM